MLNPDINRFLGTLLYPITDVELLFDDPLAAFFERTPTDFIVPGEEKSLNENKQKVFDAAAKFIAGRFTVDSYDQIFQYMERWYVGQAVWRCDAGKPLYHFVFKQLCRLSFSMISKLDGQIIYKYWQTEEDASLLGGFAGNDKIHLFRSLTQLIPMDILAAIFLMDSSYAQDALGSFYGLVSITDAPLERVLSQGVAENHLHMGAAAGFSVIWEDLMRPDVRLNEQAQELPMKSPDTPSRSKLYFYWLLARSLRMCLALCVPDRAGLCAGVAGGSGADPIQALSRESLKALCDSLCGTRDQTDTILAYFQGLDEALSSAVLYDASSPLLSGDSRRLTEPFFLLRMFKSFAENPALLPQQTMFLQYLRLKHYIFHLMVQSKTVSGLDHFQLYYGSSSASNKAAAKFGRNISGRSQAFQMRQLRAQLSTPHIRRLEFRTSFFDRERDARSFLSNFLRAYRQILVEDYCTPDPTSGQPRPVKPFPQVGIVFHFLKSSQETPDVCFRSEDKALRTYSELHDHYALQLSIFKNLRDPTRYPGIDRYLVGIDVASLENSVPTWVFRDIYDSARDAKSEPFALPGKRPFQSLGFTFHAGEDFRHLLSGLRRVYEVVHFLKFHAGDRLGHGLALGVLVDDWCAEHPNVLLPRIEALENYLWAYHMLSTYPSEQNTGNLLYLEQRIQHLSGKIFVAPGARDNEIPMHIPTPVLLQSYKALFRKNLFSSGRKACEDGCTPEEQEECHLLRSLTTCEDILAAYHCCHYTKYMNEPIHYHLPPQEIVILKELQEMLQRYVSRRGVIVEVNPSSNVIIGQMDTIHAHPMYQFSSCRCDYKDIMVCVNSDDPGVFQTNTANELGISYMGMVERGVGRESCLEWIERLRESGMRGSFIRRTDSDMELLEELDKLIKEL